MIKNIKLIKILFFQMALVGIFQLFSCGGTSTTTSSGTDSGGTSSSGGGNASSGGSSSNFQIVGKLDSLTVSALGLKDSSSGSSVTDVMAVSPTPGGTTCKTASVDSNGSFKLGVTGKSPWYFFFYNRAQKGRSMFSGRFRTSVLNTLVPASSSGSADLGNIKIDGASETATSDKSHDEIIASLGLDSTSAASIGKVDEVVRRYSNPDVDGDGKVDCQNSSNQFILDFHVRFDMKINGQKATVSDLIDQYLDETTATATYINTGIYIAYPNSYSSATSGSVTFVDSQVTTSEGGTIPANTTTSLVTNNDFGDFHSFGPNITDASNLPSGDIIFTFGGKTLTFSDVKTPTLTQLNAPTGRFFPFIKFNKSVSTCTANCTLSGLSYKWMKKTDSGWTAASLGELGLIIASKGGFVSIRVGSDSASDKSVGITLPISSIDGTVDWTAANAHLGDVSETAFKAMTTTDICHLGISYDDQLGMRYFEGVSNATGTCL